MATLGAACYSSFFAAGSHSAVASVVVAAAVLNVLVATFVQPASFFAIGTAPDRSPSAKDERQNAVHVAETHYEKSRRVAPERRDQYRELIALLDNTVLHDAMVLALGINLTGRGPRNRATYGDASP